MTMSMRWFRWLLLAAWGVGLSLSPVGAQKLPLPDWTLNPWGNRPTLVDAQVDVNRCGTAGFYYAKQRQGDGEAELILPGVLIPGRAYRFTVQMKKVLGDGQVDVMFRRTGPNYETTSIRTVKPSSQWQTVTLSGIYDAPSQGAVRVGLRAVGLGICMTSPTLERTAVENIGGPVQWHEVPSTFPGVHLNRLGRHNGWPAFNPSIVRMWDTGTTWADLQPQPGPIDWRGNEHAQRLDYFLAHVRKFNPKGDLLMTLGMTPVWAAPADAPDCGSDAYYGRKTCWPPARLEDWRRYVRELATRYKGRVRYWEVLNEADIPMHWRGSPEQLVELVKAANEELKAVDPGNVLIGPNVTMMGYRLLNDFLRLGGARYVDAISVHVYMGRSPNLVFSKLRNVREMLINQGVDLPLWNTESGSSCSPEVDCDHDTGVDGVSSVAQSLVGQAALGVANVSYYTWEGGVVSGGGLPLVQSDYESTTRAGDLVKRVMGWLRGASVRWEASPVDKVRRVGLKKPGQSCSVLWTDAGEVRVAAATLGKPSRLQDALGSDLPPDEQGRFTVTTLPAIGCVADAAR